VAAEPGWACITNHGLTRLSDGTVLFPVIRAQHLTTPDPSTGATRVVRAAFTCSPDGGLSWGPCGGDLAFDRLSPLYACAYGKVMEVAGGRLLVPVFGMPRAATRGQLRTAGVAFSEDGGQSWQDFVPIYEDLRGDVCPSETDVIQLADGRLLAMIRANAARRLYRSWSEDEGRSWTPMEPTDLPGQCPALIRLASGALLCAYRDVTPDQPGLACAVSPDGGVTWHPIGALYRGENHDCAYPSLVRLSRNTLYCAFYTAPAAVYTGSCEIHGLVLEDRS
jgi:BNR repeat-like domain